MYQNYNYYPQQQSQNPQQVQYQQPSFSSYVRPQMQSGLKGRPVSSIEEARASTLDFDGSIFYFPDLANKRIYTKQINMDGTSTLNMYELKDVPVEQVNAPVNYVTREEFEAALRQLRDSLTPSVESAQPGMPQKPEILSF